MTDWDKELAKIDKQLANMSDADLVGEQARPALPAAPAGRPSKAAAPAPVKDEVSEASGGAKFMLYARVLLSVALAVGMIFWPYDAKCGAGLGLYLAAVAAVLVSGVWSAIWSWRHRAARLHTLSLLLILWGLVLGSLDVLPRVGYAKPDLTHPANWICK
jgi:putative flippase GtrA